MKIYKMQKGEESGVSRKLIAKFGESIYHNADVESISIRVHFKDGSSIGFHRDEEEDEYERCVIEEE